MDLRVDELEAIVAPALARIVGDGDVSLGTGFVVDRGVLLTCLHVVADRGVVQLRFENAAPIPVAPDAIEGFAGSDLALLRFSGHEPPPISLIGSGEPPNRFWTKGYHAEFEQRGAAGPFPVQGEISGSARISYRVGDHGYTPTILVLTRGDVGGGLSGAPLMDPESGAAYGVVVADVPRGNDTRGFAVSVSDAAKTTEQLRSLLERNDTLVPRFGKRINRLGARELCDLQVERGLAELRQRQLFLPAFFCERTQLSAELARIGVEDANVIPVIGLAGVGKTSLLAWYAVQSKKTRATLLLRGLAISEGDVDVESLIDGALRPLHPSPCTRAADLTKLLSNSGLELLILLDGLNEARASARHLVDRWLPGTTEWLHATRSRLIVTCREEYWETLQEGFRGARLLYASQGGEDAHLPPSPLRVQIFSEPEAREAARRYGLTPQSPQGIWRHPLMLRFARDLRSQPGQASDSPLEESAVIEAWIHACCVRVTRSMTQVQPGPSGRTHSARVRATVSEVARLMWADGLQEIPLAARAKLDERAEFLDPLVDEYLLVLTPTGYRFSFDEVSEYLQSSFIDIEDLKHPAKLVAHSGQITSWNVVVHAIAGLVARGSRDDAELAIEALCVGVSSAPGLPVHMLFRVIERIGARSAAALWVERLVLAAARDSPRITHSLTSSRCDQLALPPSAFLRLVRALLPEERRSGWRFKDWRNPDRRRDPAQVFSSRYSMARLVGRALEGDGEGTLRTLSSWMGDRTELDGGEASISDFALACMFYGRAGNVELLCELAVGHWASDLKLLALTLAEVEPLAVLEAIAKWKGHAEYASALCALVTSMPKQEEPEAEAHRVSILVHLIESRPSRGIGLAAAASLGSLSEHRERVWPMAKAFYLQPSDSAWLGAYSLLPFFDDYADEIVPLFCRQLKALAQRDRSDPFESEIVACLTDRIREVGHLRQFLEVVVAQLHDGRSYAAGRMVEDLLYRRDLQPGALDLPEFSRLVSWLLEADDESAVTCVMYGVFATEDRASTARWRREVIGYVARTSRYLDTACAAIAPVCRERGREAYGWLTECFRGKPAATIEPIVLSQVMDDDFLFLKLVEAEWRANPRALGPVALTYLAQRDRGLEPDEAASAALRPDEES